MKIFFSFAMLAGMLSFSSQSWSQTNCSSSVRLSVKNVYDTCANYSSQGLQCTLDGGVTYIPIIFEVRSIPQQVGTIRYIQYVCVQLRCDGTGIQNGIVDASGCADGLLADQANQDFKKPSLTCSSIVQNENQNIGEQIPLTGTSFGLIYFSQYQFGRSLNYLVKVPLTGSIVDPNILGYTVTVKDSQNNTFDTASFSAATNQTYSFIWDGEDLSNVLLQGPREFQVIVAQSGSDFSPSLVNKVTLGAVLAKKIGLGGWLPSNWHFYSHETQTLFSANGEKRQVAGIADGGYTRVADTDAKQVFYFYPNGNLALIKLGITGQTVLTFTYDSNGFLTGIQEPFSRNTTVTRSSGVAVSITAPNGKVTALQIDSGGDLASVTNPNSEAYSMTYHSGSGLLATFTKPNGAINSFSYDSLGNLTLDAHSGGKSLSLLGQGSQVDITTALGRLTSYKKNLQGDTITETRADGSSRSSRLSQLVESIRDRLFSSDTQYIDHPRFGPQARKISTDSTSGLATRATFYSHNDQVSNPLDPYSIQSLSTQVHHGNPSLAASIQYVESTKTRTLTTPLSRTQVATIDQYERPTQTQHGNQTPVQFAYSNEKLTAVTQGARVWAFEYDSGTSLLESVTNPLNQTTMYGYDLSERLIYKILPDLTEIHFGYDGVGNLTSIQPPGRPFHYFTFNSKELLGAYDPPVLQIGQNYQTTFSYNSDEQLTQIVRPDSRQVSYTYNSSTGQLSSMNADGVVTNFSYVWTSEYPSTVSSGGKSVYFEYSGGVPQYMDFTFSGVTTRYLLESISADGKVSAEKIRDASGNFSTIAMTYDNDELLTGAGSLSIGRNVPNGQIVSSTLGSLSDAWAYNSFGELDSYSAMHASAGDLYEEVVTRDLMGRVTQKQESYKGEALKSTQYVYDSLGRLAEVKRNNVTESTYVYDSNGNRTAGTIRGQSTSGTYDDQDRLSAYNVFTYAYNLNGDLVSKTNTLTSVATSYTYDVNGALTQVVVSPSKTVDYELDPLGRRFVKKVNSVVDRKFLYDLQGRLIAELDSSNLFSKRYVYGTKAHVPDYYIQGGVNYRMITDHLGSLRMVVNSSTGEVVQVMEYDEFGRVRLDTRPGLTAFGFAGGLYDCDTGLVRFGARDYDPYVGRWTSKDPILFAGGDANLFSYVASDPVNWTDPSGLCPWCIVGGVVAGLLYSTDTDTPGSAQSEMIGVPLAIAGGYAAGLSATSQYSIRGGELVITRGGQQTRINPTGDANSCQPGGKLPHYHRSNPDPMNPGQSIPGQGIGRHRPWDVRSTDRSFWDRF